MAYVSVTCGDGRPIEELTKLIQQRSKWLNETAEEACAACMIDVLVSLRALTKTAKPKKNEIVVEETSLTPSYTTVAKGSYQFCLRQGKARYVPQKKELIVRRASEISDVRDCKVYRWHDYNKRVCLIVARSKQDATNWAFERIKKRATRYKGLARIIWSVLMKQTGTKSALNVDNANAASKASTLARVIKSGNGSSYSIEARDLLDYAKLALKGGESSVNQAIMKASNKIASVINQKCKNLLTFEKLDTPFPELRSRK